MAPSIMAGSSRHASPMKRLMTELQTYQSDPNEALLELGPPDDDVMHWNAVMKGVVGTAYEGTYRFLVLARRKRAWR
jgi:peroxin-4